ncbi:MAG TPA: biosynthetic arginine decarboxylase, partial [Phycisphaerales bacterium]|nr:biosynthetic arginine decarboxylase [Phycisphaerales bacterium]
MATITPGGSSPAQTLANGGSSSTNGRNGGAPAARPWSIEDAMKTYAVRDWGAGYFGINTEGHLVVMPEKHADRQIDLYEVLEGLRDREISTPVIIRFRDLLKHRLTEIREAFDTAIKEHGYGGSYSCIYPIKVNQQRQLCEEVRDIGSQLDFGLEAGSKPELLAVLGLTENLPSMPIVCNGFKDSEFIETVILATKLGRHIIPVVERFSDLELIVKHAKRYNVRPRIGVRAKPSARGSGKWESSGGMRSKFGLTVIELLHALDFLKQHQMADCLKMIHFHIGSQIGDIRHIKAAVNELSHIYCELKKLGAGLDTIDVGGGMGIDYDGSQSDSPSSVNYGVAEYAADIVYRVKSVCDAGGFPHPRIFSESGRAMVAHSSLLIVDVLGKTDFPAEPDIEKAQELMRTENERPQPVLELIDAYESLSQPRVNIVEVYHDAMQARDEAMSLFNLGYLSLPMRSATERLFWAIGRRVLTVAQSKGELPDDLIDLPQVLSDIYYVNFSLFQSLPDHWAIDQLFPICPIHRLGEEPGRRAILADITCDSDGQVDKFIDRKSSHKPVLELHELKYDAAQGKTEPYYLGMFLLGAYQEVLGDLHNLYGDTHVVHVSFDDSPGVGDWDLDEVIEGDTVKEVLSYVQYDSEDLVRSVRRDVERAVKAGKLSVPEAQNLLKFYDSGMEGYTYLE